MVLLVGYGTALNRMLGSGRTNAQAGKDAPDMTEGAQGEFGQKKSPADAEPITVGRATTIRSPYEGVTPENTRTAQTGAPRAEISTEAVQAAQAQIEQARQTPQFKATLRHVFQQIFQAMGGQRKVTLENATFDGVSYDVARNPNIAAKVVSDPAMSAEKLVAFTKTQITFGRIV